MARQKSIFLTGVNSGIGLELTKILLHEGFLVTGVVRSLESIGVELALLQDRLKLMEADLSKPEDAARLSEEVKSETFGYIVLNAGCAKVVPAHRESDENIHTTIQTNLISNICLVRSFLPQAVQQDTKIVFVSSLSAHVPASQYASYAASKAGLSQYYHSLKKEYPELSLLCLEPGAIDTPLHIKSGSFPESKKMFKDQEKYAQKMFKAIRHKTGVHTLYWDWRLIRTLMRVIQ